MSPPAHRLCKLGQERGSISPPTRLARGGCSPRSTGVCSNGFVCRIRPGFALWQSRILTLAGHWWPLLGVEPCHVHGKQSTAAKAKQTPSHAALAGSTGCQHCSTITPLRNKLRKAVWFLPSKPLSFRQALSVQRGHFSWKVASPRPPAGWPRAP